MVTDYSAPVITFDAKFVPATETGKTYTTAPGYYALPTDFKRMRSLYDVADLTSPVIQRTSIELEELRRHQQISVGAGLVYAVEKDPFPEGHTNYSDDLFLLPYPYPGKRTTLRGKYVADNQQLSGDTDVPLIPRNHRDVIQYVAAWRLAMTFREGSQLREYKAVADEAIKDLLHEYDFAVDKTSDVEAYSQLIGPVDGPPSFPRWRI